MTDREVRARLIDLFVDGSGAGRYVSPAEARDAGIPNRWVGAVSQASRHVKTDLDAVEAASQFAAEIEADEAAQRAPGLDPRLLAARHPRGA